MEITLKGQVPAQKNQKKINTRGGRPVLYTAKAVKDWQEEVGWQLKKYVPDTPIEETTIVYKFYVKDLRRRDLDNMICSVNDALVKANILKDDTWKCLSIGGAEAELDRNNPRVELWLDA